MATMTARSLVTAVFDTRGKAESAIDNLRHAGFRHDQIGILTPGGHVAEATTSTEKTEEKAATGAVTGAVLAAPSALWRGPWRPRLFPASVPY